MMLAVEGSIDTNTAIVAMLEIFLATYTTKSAIRAMIWLFFCRHPKVTFHAMIITKLNIARNAEISLTTLALVAFSAYHFNDIVTVDLVVIFFR